MKWKIFFFAGLATLGFCWFLHAYVLNQLTKGTYLMQDYEKRIEILSQERKNLKIAFAESGFMGSIEQKTRELNFEKTTEIKYIQILDNSVAVKK